MTGYRRTALGSGCIGRACLTAAGLLAAMLAAASGRRAEVQRTRAGRGLAVSVVHDVLVGRDGLLWVGSREGLYSYDGYEATGLLSDPDDPHNIGDLEVRALYEADDGALWVGTQDGGVSRRDPDTGRFERFRHDPADPRSLSDPTVLAIAQDGEGYVWVGTLNGLNRLDPDHGGFTRHHHAPDRPSALGVHSISRLHRDSRGDLWVATHGAGVLRWDPKRNEFESYSLAQITGGSRGLDSVFSIQAGRDGRLWVGTRDGLLLLDPARREARLVRLAGDAGPEPFIAALHVDRLGRLWIGTLAHGLLVAEQPIADWPRAAELVPESIESWPAALQSLSLESTHDSLIVGTWGAGVYRAPLEDPGVKLLARASGDSGMRNRTVAAVLGTATPGRPWMGSHGPERVDVTAGRVSPRRALRPIRSLAPTCSASRSPRTANGSPAPPRASTGST